MNISLVMPGRNNLKYLKWSYASVRKNQGNHNVTICFADDASVDGTASWISKQQKIDPKLKAIQNPGPERNGHCILYDKIVRESVTDDIFMIWHCDMYLCPGALDYIEKYIKPQTVVSLTRIEPPLHNPDKAKIIADFGIEPELFIESDFLKWYNNFIESPAEFTTEGIFAPWAIYKNDFLSIGGHDDIYKPQSREDSDVFNRFLLNNYKFIQTRNGHVYHMTCRGSRFNPFLTTVGTASSEWLIQNNKSERNFIRKWGTNVKHNEYLKPIVFKKYDVGFIIRNCSYNVLYHLEPWCSSIYVNSPLVGDYTKKEQSETKFDLSKRIKYIDATYDNNILIEFDANLLNNDNVQFIYNLSDILTDSGQIGEMELDIFKLRINSLETYENRLIKLDDPYYTSQLIAT